MHAPTKTDDREEALLPQLDVLLQAIRDRRENFARNAKLDPEIYALMKQVGIYRVMAPKRFGGEEWAPARFLRMIETISAVDGSAGWCASFGITAAYNTVFPLPTLEEIYANGPDVSYAGGNAPSQYAARVPGGYRVSGRWPFASGCNGADYISVGIEVDDGKGGRQPLIALLPASEVEIDETWRRVNGMRGTGSHDVIVKDKVVRESWCFARTATSNIDAPLYRYPGMGLSPQVLSTVGLGIARSAIDQFIDIAMGKTSLMGGTTFANRPSVQTEVAKCDAALRAARAFLFGLAEETYALVSKGGTVDQKLLTLLRMSGTNAAAVAADVATRIYTIAGTSGFYADGPFGRTLQDALVVPQHAFISDSTWQQYGGAMLGQELKFMGPGQ